MFRPSIRLKSILFCLFILAFSTNLYSQISISVNKEKIKTVLKMVEKQSGYNFFYSDDFLDLNKEISVKATNENLSLVLNHIFDKTDIKYEIKENKQIVLSVQKKGNTQPAKKRKISGTVKDDSNEALIGVSVIVKGEQNGTMTDVNGQFSLDVPEDGTLNFSYLGFNNEDVKIAGKSKIDIVLSEKSEQLNEVVVTALGMKREEKALGYSVSKVDGSELITAPSNNWLDALSGKTPGLNFNKGNTGPAGSVRVTLRGESSLDLSNNGALFVVDGVPISNGMTAGGSSSHDVNSGDRPIDFGNGSSDINPEDIESVTVLKGASATALYGSRAGGGVILITTKSGKTKDRIGVTFSSTVAFDKVSRWPDLQTTYGSGGQGKNLYYSFQSTEDGASTHSSQSWGPSLNGQLYYQYYQEGTGLNLDANGDRLRSPWVSYDNWFKGFFQTGATYTNTVTLEGGNGKDGSMRVSFTDRRNDWILENTGFRDQRIAFSGQQDISKLIKLEAKVNYYHKSSDNLPAIGYGPGSVMYALLTTSANINSDWYRNYWLTPNKEQDNRLNSNSDNPYFTLYEMVNTQARDRVFGNINATFNLHKKFSAMLRGGIDMNQEERTYTRPWSSKMSPNGEYREQIIQNYEMNMDFMLKYDDKFGADQEFGVTATFGGNHMKMHSTNENQTARSLLLPGYYTLANAVDNVYGTKTNSKKVINSMYGLIQLSYKNYLFADITGRNDWSSTLPIQNNSYFYPSISTSLLFNEMLDWKNDKLSFSKLRLSYAKVGNDTKAYQLSRLYAASEFGGSYTISTTVPDINLKPEDVTSYEIGTELKFLNNKAGLDVTYYNSESSNLIVNMPVDPSSGAWNVLTNAGKIRNRGWEVAAFVTPVSTKEFTWRVNASWSKNSTEVLKLADGISSWIISSGPRGQIEARVGGTMTAMYGSGFKRAPEGTFITNSDGTTTDVSNKIMYDATTGYPIVDTENSKYIGDVSPDWKGSLGSTFTYKAFTMKILFDMQKGGKVYSLSNNKLNQFGKTTKTLEGRYEGLIGDGVVLNSDGSYSMNTTVTKSISEYYATYYGIDNVEANMVETEYIKLRELSLEYNVPKKVLNKIKFIKSASFSIYGRDLYCWTNYPIFDPEVATLNGSEITPGFETAQFPSTRSFGASVRVSF